MRTADRCTAQNGTDSEEFIRRARTGPTRARRSATNATTAGPIFFTKPVMPWRTAKRARFSGILKPSWCSSTVSHDGRPLPSGLGTVRERHME